MGTLHYYEQVVIHQDGEPPVRAGSITTPISITIDGEVEDKTLAIADETTNTLWWAGSGVPGFKFLRILSDQTVYIELIVDTDEDEGQEQIAFEVVADRPFTLLSNIAAASYTTGFASLPLTADVIDEILIRNDSGEVANVRIILAK